MSTAPDLAVILAAGRGSRMMADAPIAAGLDPDQRAKAGAGLKMLVPIRGRPFIAWILDAVQDAGFREALVVTSPHAAAVQEALLGSALKVTFTQQSEPRGTADAVLAAESAVGRRPFVVINGDNWYPPAALATLRSVAAPATIGFRAMERVEAFALITTDTHGCLAEIAEKPDAATRARLGAGALVSMTCWSFTHSVFDACRAITPSARGELELPDAVRHLVARGTCVRVMPHEGPVLDLGRAADIPLVERRLP